MNPLVVINETHTLLPDQERVLRLHFGDWEIFPVPANGMSLEEMRDWVRNISHQTLVVLVSPVPALFVLLARRGIDVATLHNDKRVAKEVPDGHGGIRLVHAVAPEGWQFVRSDVLFPEEMDAGHALAAQRG